MIRLLILFLFISVLAFPQDKMLSLESITVDSKLRPKKITQLQWKDNRYFTYIDTNGLFLRQMDTRSEESTLLMQLQEIREMMPDSLSSLSSFPSIKWRSANTFSFSHDGYFFSYRLGSDSLRWEAKYPISAKAVDPSKTLNVAYVEEHNLYVWKNRAEKATQITTDGHRKLQYGVAASRFEFGIRKGTFWSPQGDKLAFFKVDHTHVADYPLTNYSDTPATTTLINYPMNGDSSQQVSLGVYDLETGKTRYLEIRGAAYDQYLTNITWSPGGNYIFIAQVNREQDEMRLNQYDARSGLYIKTLFTETDEKYVEPENGPIFFPETKDQFLWFSERDGWNHLYLYKTSGELVKQITTGEFEVTAFIGFDDNERFIFYQSTEASPLSRHIYRHDIEKDEVERITDYLGMHTAQVNEYGNYLLVESQSFQKAYMVRVFHKGTFKDTEYRLYEAPDPLEGYKLGEDEIVELDAKDGSKLYGRLIKPADFEKGKKYPVLNYVYGGPHIQLVNNDWLFGARLFQHYMAQQGFVVFTLDTRGSAYRGLAFEQQVYRQMGTVEMEDQVTAVAYLKSLPFVDDDKMAVFGWSYGGYMAGTLMLRKPDLFQVGVAGGPVTNWRYYEVMYSERYMDRHQDNPEGFRNSRLSNHAANLKGDLLIIHGMQDSTVVPQHSMELMREFVKNNKVVDFFPYPSYPHNVRGPERAHLYKVIERYIKKNLNIQ